MLQNRQQPNALPPLRKPGRVYSSFQSQSPTHHVVYSNGTSTGLRNGTSSLSRHNNSNNDGDGTVYNNGTSSLSRHNNNNNDGTIYSNGTASQSRGGNASSYSNAERTIYSGGTVFNYNGNVSVAGSYAGGTFVNGNPSRRPEYDDQVFSNIHSEINDKTNIQTASILKKTGIGQRRRYSSTPSLHLSFNNQNLQTTDASYRSPQTDRRRVNFKTKVSIYRFGGSESDRIGNSTEIEPLKDPSSSSSTPTPPSNANALPIIVSPPYSSIYIADEDDVQPDRLVASLANRSPPLTKRLSRRQTNSNGGQPMPIALPQDPNCGPLVFHTNAASVVISGAEQTRPNRAFIGHVDYARTVDNCLQMVIRLDTRGRDVTLRPNDLLVKANKTGDRFRVVTNQEAEERLRINELVKLPCRVDAHNLVARLDPSGHLIVHAPILK